MVSPADDKCLVRLGRCGDRNHKTPFNELEGSSSVVDIPTTDCSINIATSRVGYATEPSAAAMGKLLSRHHST